MTTNVIGASLPGGQAASSTSRYASSGPTSARYGDSTTTSGTPGIWRSKASRTLAAAARSSVMNTARTSSLIERADVDRLDDGPVQARDRDDDPLLAMRRPDDERRVDGQLRASTARTAG